MKQYITEIDPQGKIAVDDTILVAGVEATAGSKILGGFKPLFDAEAVVRLKNAGYALSGKTNVGEFGLDLLGETSYSGAVTGEGGKLEGASARLLAEGKIEGALCVDLNGAPRRAAAVSGVVFVKPTYGTVSRYGVIPCACSGEQIGVMAPCPKCAGKLLSVIAGHDGKDGTSLYAEKYEYSTDKDVSAMKIAVIRELLDAAEEDSAEKVKSAVSAFEKAGAKVEFISVPEVLTAQAAWQILLAAETCNNISRYDGVKFGYRTPEYADIDELYVRSRTEGMDLLAKETLIYGSDVLSKGRYDVCYDKALRARRVVFDKLRELFAEYDVLLTPACSTLAFMPYGKKDAFRKVYEESLFTAFASITGVPAVAAGGVQLVGKQLDESTLLSAAKIL